MTRYEIASKALENDEIDASTFGQLDMHNFSTKSIINAVRRSWITGELAEKMLDAKGENKADANRNQIEAQITTFNSKIDCYKESIQGNIKSIQEAAARLTLDRCSEVESIQAYAKRIAEAKARIEELDAFVTALKFMLARSAPKD